MAQSMTNKVQWGILALSAALLFGAARAQAQNAPDAETPMPPDSTAPHRIRVGVAPVKASMTAQAQPQSANFGEPLRGLLMSQLTGPVEVMPLTGITSENAVAEAKQKECDFVLYTVITRQPRAGAKLGFFHGASQIPIPMVGAGRGLAGAPASVTAGALLSGAGEAARLVKAKDELALEFRLVADPAAAPVLSNSLHAKATEDGQDVITPLVEQEASAVLNAIRERADIR